MITIQRPGQSNLEIDFILIGFEGTLASDRRVHPKAKDKINLLSKRTKIYILTKEEKDRVGEVLKKIKAETVYLSEGESSQKKLNLLRQLGPAKTVAIGGGLDDVPIIEEAGLGVCVLSREGTSSEAMKKADLVFMNVLDALDFLLKPLRQKTTLGK